MLYPGGDRAVPGIFEGDIGANSVTAERSPPCSIKWLYRRCCL